MESFVSIIAWSFLLGALLLLPALLFFCLRLQARKKKPASHPCCAPL